MKVIIFDKQFNQSIDNLPNSLIEITFRVSHNNHGDNKFNQNINWLPNQLSKLILPHNFNSKICNYPPNLKYLYLGKKFNQTLDNLPETIEILIFDSKYEQKIYKLPNVKHLTISKFMKQSEITNILPDSLISLYLPDDIQLCSINKNILMNLKKLKISIFNCDNFVLDIIKNSNLKEIILQIIVVKLEIILTNLPQKIKKITILNCMIDNERIETKLLPIGLIFFQINGIKYDENKLKKIKQDQFYTFG